MTNFWYFTGYLFQKCQSTLLTLLLHVIIIIIIINDFNPPCIYFHLGKHGDNNNFDGPGGSIGHVEQSTKNIHFDDEEYWTAHAEDLFLWKHPRNGTDFIQAAMHEIGHILGLDHSNDTSSVMTPTMIPSFHPLSLYTLSNMDIARVKASWGTLYFL